MLVRLALAINVGIAALRSFGKRDAQRCLEGLDAKMPRNSDLASKQVTNWTLSDRVRR